MGECTYRQLQQERVQLLIGQSTLQIQEQSTLGTMQQSSLQHYSVLGSLLGNCMEIVRKLLGWYIGWAVQITGKIIQEFMQHYQSLHANYRKERNHLRQVTGTTRLTRLTRWGIRTLSLWETMVGLSVALW